MNYFTLLVLLAGATFPIISAQTPLLLGQFGGKQFYRGSGAGSTPDTVCQNSGMKLATIRSVDEMSYVQTILTKDGGTYHWTAGSDTYYTWPDKSLVTIPVKQEPYHTRINWCLVVHPAYNYLLAYGCASITAPPLCEK